MRLMLVPSGSFSLDDAVTFEACQANARKALSHDLDLARVKVLCEFLDFPQADEATLDLQDPLRFATVRVMGYLRQHHDGAEAVELCRFSPTARDLHALVAEEPQRRSKQG